MANQEPTKAALALEPRGDDYVIKIADGTGIPAGITVVNNQGHPVAVYRAEAITQPQARSAFDNRLGVFDISYAAAWDLGR
ncbi:hypothetical protein [Streptomyces cinnamoneus]|uniref:Uncharacterized protein n=1 Tax=Streptomyces cinnamoneus TaxID=53446 RepID=A0A918U1W1_STRCJ|nr:hypothetical protein [Streptomyces cinnamoneus]GHC72928.1 hypothetical protein GCM10010507_60160 [Streptomyces cinnamoneus]